MAQQRTTIDVQSRFGVKIPNPLTYHEPPVNKLLVMLPGRGYTIESPALFFLRQMALDVGYDVLGLQYGFQMTGGDFDETTAPYLKEDITNAIRQTVQRQAYQQVCIAAKSLGTLLVAEAIEAASIPRTSAILLTPLPGAIQEVGSNPTLAIIGTGDALYSPEMVSASSNLINVRWRVFDGLNHALEVKGEWGASIDALRDVVAECELFLTSQA
jgi:hypothetical protein